MSYKMDLTINLSRAIVLGAVLIILGVAFVPPNSAAAHGAGEALFARLILWSAVVPLAILANSRVRRLRIASSGPISRRLVRSTLMTLICATSLLWDVVATALYFLGWANVPTSMFVLAIAAASGAYILLTLR